MTEIAIQTLLEDAAERYRRRQLAEAEELCRQILAEQPAHTDAISLSGVIARKMGRNELAVDLLSQAVALAPASAGIYYNLANALRDVGKLSEAITAYRHAITLEPGLARAHTNLANSLKDNSQLDAAIEAYRRVIELKPDSAQAYSNLGTALAMMDKSEQAIAAFGQAIALNPNLPEAYYNLGNSLAKTGRQQEAAAAYRQAIAIRPTYAKACVDLGHLLRHMGELTAAAAAAREAIAIDRASPQGHFLLGTVLAEQNQPEAGIAAFREAIALNPGFTEAHGNLGAMLKTNGTLDDAIDACRQAITLNAELAQLQCNLGAALKDTGRVEEAISACKQAVKLNPQDASFHSCLAGTLHYHPGYDAHSIAEENRRWNQRHAQPLAHFIKPHLNDLNPDRRLRIGYVSPDFRTHTVATNLLPWFGHHDHSQFDIFCYAQVRSPDEITTEFQYLSDSWRNIVGLSDQQVADRIREDRIDILVDLALHTADNRLLVFARKPAPVQVTFAGYPGSTGLTAIDYRLSDPYLDPPGMDESVYSEKTIHLANSFWCYDPRENRDLELNDLPSLNIEWFTFGCLNNFCKINQPLLTLWAKVLREVKDSRLMMLAPVGSHRARTVESLGQLGIDSARVSFIEHRPRREYLKAYHQIDLGLDTFPYNGHTTSLDSFWMGVPVVTLVGSTVVSRAGWSQLSNLGLIELAAHDPEEFVRIAVELAQDRPRLAQLRSTLRRRMEQSPLIDGKQFAGSIESAYRRMWRTHCLSSASASALKTISE